MQFSVTGEVSQSVFKKKVRVSSYIERNLLQGQIGNSLETLDMRVNFCPILMDEDLRRFYPARSKTDKKEKVYYCCPQLNYQLFKTGSFKDQLGNCIDELLLADKPLKTLGATPQQRATYRDILERIRQAGSQAKPDQPLPTPSPLLRLSRATRQFRDVLLERLRRKL